jgi:hypothetical protein
VAPLCTVPSLSSPEQFDNLDILDQDYDIDTLDDDDPILPVMDHFTTVAYTDASFAVGNTKDSYSGFVCYLCQ